MQFADLLRRAEVIRQKYRTQNEAQGLKPWGAAEYAQGLAGDFGDLSKLILAKNSFRQIEGVDHKLEHELADCLWSLFVIAHELNIDLEKSFIKTMDEIEARLSES